MVEAYERKIWKMKILCEFAFSVCWCHSVLSNKSVTHFHLLHEFLISSFLIFFYNSTQDLHSGEFLERLGHCFFLGANTIAIPKALQTIPFNTLFSCFNYQSGISFLFFFFCYQEFYYIIHYIVQFSSVQSLSNVRLFVTPWISARQASLSITNS